MSSPSRLAAVIAPLVLSLAACGQSGTTAGSGGASSGAAGGPAGSGGGATTQGNGGMGGGGAGTAGGAGPGGSGQGGTTSSTTGAGGGSTLFPAGTICNDSGTPRTAPAMLKHVIVILFENEDASSVNENSAPYMTSIAKDCGYANNFVDNCFTTNQPSLPHYLALTSGSNCNTGLGNSGSGCISNDNDATPSNRLSTTSIFKEVSSWKSYQENMPSACDKSSSGLYACKHNPAAYYSGISSSSCSADDVPIAAVTCDANMTNTPCSNPSNAFVDDIANDNLPAYAFVTPNLENDMHNGSVTKGDNWLHTYLPLILNSKSYLNGEVVVMALWDEQSTSSFGGATPNIFISPYITKGTVSQTKMNLFAVLRAAEDALGVTTHAGCASGTPPGGVGNCPQYSTTNVRSALGF